MPTFARKPSKAAAPRDRRLNGEKQIPIDLDADIVRARREGRTLAAELGFSAVDATLIATAISELARNIGPGIPDTRQALQDGFSTSGRLGMGLPGVRRLMDDFEIVTGTGNGTEVIASKWRP